tara:strand:- start:2097 stop:2591 length:495 start_codon:yes stop_codon:yes gene_type:complete
MVIIQIANLVATSFPNGMSHYLIGGILIGGSVVFMYLTTGQIVGASTMLETTVSYYSKLEWFQQEGFVSSRDWRLVFTIGLIVGAAGYTLVSGAAQWMTEVQWWRLLIGGLFIGIGARLGKGCTSGHGICGLASFSPTSLINVIVFLGIAIIVAHLTEIAGVVP